MREVIIEVSGRQVQLTFEDTGSGNVYFLLHGGAGAGSMHSLIPGLSPRHRVILPSHPGFDGTDRPEWLTSPAQIADLYMTLLEKLNVDSVIIIGNSFGGWLAAEIALLIPEKVTHLVLMDSIGIQPDVETGPIGDPLKLGAEVVNYAFHDPQKFAAMLSNPDNIAQITANQKALAGYAGNPFMYEPGLKKRLFNISVPTTVIWGKSDRIVTEKYGKKFAAAIPAAKYVAIENAGHFPQIEQTDQIFNLII